jgi:hypothetical protein
MDFYFGALILANSMDFFFGALVFGPMKDFSLGALVSIYELFPHGHGAIALARLGLLHWCIFFGQFMDIYFGPIYGLMLWCTCL